MLRRLTALVMLFSLPFDAQAQSSAPELQPPRPLMSAFAAASDGRWTRAAELAERDGPGAVAIVEWQRLRAKLGTPAELLSFIDEHPDWPRLDDLRERNEDVMAGAGFDDVLRFYDGYRPRTGRGLLSYARALTARGQVGEAKASVVLGWRTLDLSTEEHNTFIAEYEALLEPHHGARLQMALWRGLRDVRLMLPLVEDDTRTLAEARQRIESGRSVEDSALPEGGAEDPGIAYERFNQHIKRGRDAQAIALLIKQSRSDAGLGEPARWAGWRRYLARERMRAGEPQTAYEIASVHGLVEGSSYSDLEWLSGYLALTYLDEPALALDHFQRFRAAVETPISLGRAGYWLGRAKEALGDTEAAQISYAFGAQFQTSFYGQLAAERAGIAPDPALAGTPPNGAWRDQPFAATPIFQAGVLLNAAGRLSLAEQFFKALTDTLEEQEIHYLGKALADLEAPHLQVMVGKQAAKRGITVPAPYYALHPLIEADLPIPAELALAIARRESEFDPNVRSGAGALGLMQLMPGTASDVARDLGLRHDPSRVLSDPVYNALLGSTYLAQLIERFDGNVVMVAAGYNAGPGRPLNWMKRYGDPRNGGLDVIDWVEHIPFRETRNYVMRVAESLPVYRARLGKAPHPVPLSEELTGSTLLPSTTD